MTIMDGEEMNRLWGLVGDLTAQLHLNRQDVTNLQQQIETLKARSIHSTTGYALRRFNVDLSKEKFESELEKLNVGLVQENNELKWENRMNEKLLKEYDQCLELIMKKFRSFSHATQAHTLKLTQHYEELLATNTHDAASASLHAETALTSTLSHLGSLVRLALREVEGEGEGAALDEAEYGEAGSDSAAGTSQRGYGSTSDPRWYGSGGYTGKLGDPEAQRSDLALERAVEMQRLRYENEELRNVLKLAEGEGLDVGFAKDKLSLGIPRGRRNTQNAASSSIASSSSPEDTKAALSTTAAATPSPPRFADMPAVPTAPLPTASVPTPSSAPVPPPALPSTTQRPIRVPFSERIQQVAESINKAKATTAISTAELDPVSLSPAGSSSAVSQATNITSPPRQQQQQGSVLVPTPPDSATAQSDIRGAPLLPLAMGDPSLAEASTSSMPSGAAMTGPSSSGDQSQTVEPQENDLRAPTEEEQEEAADSAIDLNEEVGDPRPMTASSPSSSAVDIKEEAQESEVKPPVNEGEVTVPKDTVELLQEGEGEKAEAVEAAKTVDEVTEEEEDATTTSSQASEEEAPFEAGAIDNVNSEALKEEDVTTSSPAKGAESTSEA